MRPPRFELGPVIPFTKRVLYPVKLRARQGAADLPEGGLAALLFFNHPWWRAHANTQNVEVVKKKGVHMLPPLYRRVIRMQPAPLFWIY